VNAKKLRQGQANAKKKVDSEPYFRLADSDGDGVVSFDEIYKMNTDPSVGEQLTELKFIPKERFTFADENEDKSLSFEEFLVFQHPETSSRKEVFKRQKTKHEVDILFVGADIDKNDKLSFSEFRKPDGRAVELEEFNLIDENNDNSVDRSEIEKYLIAAPTTTRLEENFEAQALYIISMVKGIGTDDVAEAKASHVSLDECQAHASYFLIHLNQHLKQEL
jgi:Ca2+-binding EF-hand superfamily protein